MSTGTFNGRVSPDVVQRFWAKVQKRGPQDCWHWTGNRTGRLGHGQLSLGRWGGKQHHTYAHRLSWMLVHGPIPSGMAICHHCDVPTCVNPAHLFIGTQQDNLDDARRKGRLDESRSRRMRLPQESQALLWQMFGAVRPVREIAAEAGLTRAAIYKRLKTLRARTAAGPSTYSPIRQPHSIR